jgi:hypothetical protein
MAIFAGRAESRGKRGDALPKMANHRGINPQNGWPVERGGVERGRRARGSAPLFPNSLVAINETTAQVAVIGQFTTTVAFSAATLAGPILTFPPGSIVPMADIAFAPASSACAGTLFGVSGGITSGPTFGGIGCLFTINPATAAATPVGTTCPGFFEGNGLTFDTAGNLFYHGSNRAHRGTAPGKLSDRSGARHHSTGRSHRPAAHQRAGGRPGRHAARQSHRRHPADRSRSDR